MLNKKRALVAAVLISAMMGAVAYVHAARSQMTEITYFDAQGEIVGEVLYPCSGRVQSWGITTQSYYIETIPCF